jgi:tape measure domain-containing protein
MDIATLKIAIDTREAMAARRDLASVESQAAKTEQATVRMAKQSNQALGDMSNYVKQVAASFTAMLGIRMADEFAKINAQLKLATGSAEGFARAKSSVVAIAKEAQTSVGALATLYARLTAGSAELGFSQQKVSDITRAVALSLKVSNATTTESQSAILQLSQAMGAGALRGEEFNSVNEAAPRLMKALAEAIGVPIGALRGLAEQGKLTTEVVGYALPQALESLEKEAAGMRTILGAFQVIKDEVMLFVGATAQSSGAVSVLTGVMTLAAQNLQLLAAAATGFVATKVAAYVINLALEAKALAAATMATIAANKAAAVSTLEKARADAVATASALALSNARVAELRAAVLAARCVGTHLYRRV